MTRIKTEEEKTNKKQKGKQRFLSEKEKKQKIYTLIFQLKKQLQKERRKRQNKKIENEGRYTYPPPGG